jgi:glycosyltransferase involved in cell wall biosynthesis
MKVTLSTVTPVYSGAEYLRDLVGHIDDLRSRWIDANSPIMLIEALFVDDNSNDNSSSVLAELSEQYEWVNIVTLSRNFGQHSATVAGICHTSSDWVVTLDEDLQHDPEKIDLLMKKAIKHSADVVYARPERSTHGNSWRDKSSRFVKSIIGKLSRTENLELYNSFRIIRGSIARAAASSSSSHTYFDVAMSWFTHSVEYVEVPMEDRRYLKNKASGYGLGKLVGHARRLLISSDMDIASKGLALGILTILASFLFTVGVVFSKIFFPHLIDATGWASIVSVISLIGGATIAIVCVVLEYTSAILLILLGKPTYLTVDRGKDDILRKWYSDESLGD